MRSNGHVWWGLPAIVPCWLLHLVALGEPSGERLATNGAGVRAIELAGYLAIGTKRQDVKGEATLRGGQLSAFTLAVSSGDSGAMAILIADASSNGGTMHFGGKSYEVRPAILAAWVRTLCMSEDELRADGGYACKADGNQRTWESNAILPLFVDFPVKVRYVYDKGDNVALVQGKLVAIMAFSLAEWNNPFSESVVIHLRVNGRAG